MSKRLTKAAFFTILLMTSILFFTGYHSVDIAHATAIHHNDWNNAKLTNGYLNLRDYEDCNLLGCHRYQSFYMAGMSMILLSFIVLFSTVLFMGVCNNE